MEADFENNALELLLRLADSNKLGNTMGNTLDETLSYTLYNVESNSEMRV